MQEPSPRIQSAREGRLPFEDLSEAERVYFLDLLDGDLFNPDAETVAYFLALANEGGAVGEDESGHLVRSLPGGGIEPVS